MGTEERGALKQFSLVLLVAQVIAAAVTGAISGTFRARAEVRDVAADVVREQWLSTLQARVTEIASTSAREAADRAIRESVAPRIVEMQSHIAKDDERQVRADQRQDRTEAEIRELQRRR